MAGKGGSKKAAAPSRFAAQNRRARHDYAIEDTVEAGIVLTGSEVKSLRAGRATLNEAYAGEKMGEIFLLNVHIPQYGPSGQFNHAPKRPRKLLLHARQVARLLAAISREGMTLVPLDIHFNDKGIAKVSLGLAKGKKKYDKRQSAKEQDWKRDKARLLRDKN